MRARLAIALSIAGSPALAQPANQEIKSLEICFQSARAADAICSNPENNPHQRLNCLQKGHTELLECLDHILPGTSAGPTPPENKITGAPNTPAGTVPREMPKTVLPSTSTGAISKEVPARSASPAMPTRTVPSEMPTGAVSTDKPAGIITSKSPFQTAPSEVPTATVSPIKPTGTVSPQMPAKSIDIPSKPRDQNWVVSETTSPIDYSPLVTAVIRPTSDEKDAPSTLAIRCRQRRTELLLRTGGTWRTSRAGEIQVDYQINDQSFVRLAWVASADGRTATYKGDAFGLLRSLPEGARLNVSVFDGLGASHEATFQLNGLDAVRKKLAASCKWTPVTRKGLSGKR